MQIPRIILALISSLGLVSVAYSQNFGGISGGICRLGDPMCSPSPIGGHPIDPSPYDPRPMPRPLPPPMPPPGYGMDHRDVYVGRYLRNQDVELISLMNLSPWDLRNADLDSVEVLLRDGNRAYLSLAVDGMVVAQNSFLNVRTVLVPSRYVPLDRVRRLDLQVRGMIYVDRITLNFRRSGGYQPNPPPYNPPNQGQIIVPAQINQVFNAPVNIDLLRQSALLNYRGYRIDSIRIYGRALNSSAASALVRVMVNGTVQGQTYLSSFGGSSADAVISGTYVLGQNVNAVGLLLNGGVQIDRLEVRLVRF